MKEIPGMVAMVKAREVSKIPDGNFIIGFFQYSRAQGKSSKKLRVIERCKTRAQLPTDQWGIDSDNFFLFQDENGNPKTCYRVLIRYMGFPEDGYQLRKVNWFKP